MNRKFRKSRGQAMAEYILTLSVVAVGSVSAATLLSKGISKAYGSAAASLDAMAAKNARVAASLQGNAGAHAGLRSLGSVQADTQFAAEADLEAQFAAQAQAQGGASFGR